MRIKLTIEYDGTDFCGWQRQPNVMTVEECVEEALYKIEGTRVDLAASGRTDEGVHAYGQAAHFDSVKNLPIEKYISGLNYYLPASVKIKAAEIVGEDFHSRFSPHVTTYIYKMYEAKIDSPLLRNRAYRIDNADVSLMHDAAQKFVGTHDFVSFMNIGSLPKSTIRTVYESSVLQKENIIEFKISSNGFLYNMVRIMTACIIMAGQKKLKDDDVEKILHAKDRSLVKGLAPSYGLYLDSVRYI